MGLRSRRVGGLAGLSLAATTGLLGTYVGYPGIRRAYAVTTCEVTTTGDDSTAPFTPGELRYCLDAINTAGGGSITFADSADGTILLTDDLPTALLTSSLTITGNGSGATIIDGDFTATYPDLCTPVTGYAGLRFTGNGNVSVSGLSIENAIGAIGIVGDGQVTVSDSELSHNIAVSGGGGAIRLAGAGELTIRDSQLRESRSCGGNGGAVYRSGGGDLSIVGSTFFANLTDEDGGAIYHRGDGEVTISDSTFSNNVAYDSDGGKGGALYVDGDGAVALLNSTFTSNTAYYEGGAAKVSGTGALTITNSYFGSNRTDPEGDGGGAIYRSGGGTLTVDYSTFADNYAGNDGGAVYADGGSAATVTVTDSTFLRNATDDDGGAIHIGSSNPLTVRKSTFSANVAERDGGAIFIKSSGAVMLENSTFTGNSTNAGEGAAFYAESSGASASFTFVTMSGNTTSRASSGAVHTAGSVSVRNSIVQGNTGDDVFAVGSLTASYSLFTSSSSVSPSVTGSGLIFGEDPLLGALADNGGPTQTMMPAADSPVIGMADPVGAPATDQRGFTRTTNGMADMGAVEIGGVAPEPDLSRLPPPWFQATTRDAWDAPCPAGMYPSWSEWPYEGTGGWTCEWATWWDVRKGLAGDWVTTPGFNVGRSPGH